MAMKPEDKQLDLDVQSELLKAERAHLEEQSKLLDEAKDILDRRAMNLKAQRELDQQEAEEVADLRRGTGNIPRGG